MTTFAVITPEQLEALVRDAVASGVAEALAANAPPRRAQGSDRLTVTEAAEALRCSPRQVRRLVSSGRLRATKIASGGSSRVLVTRGSVDALLAEDA